MKLVFWGYNTMGEEALKFFIESNFEVPAVIVPAVDVDKIARIRKIVDSSTDIIPITSQPYSELKSRLEALAPELMISCSFRYKIPAELLEIKGVPIYNVHGAKLPYFRGGNMLNWTIINGEREMALTLHILEETMDTGDIIAEVTFPIAWEDDANDVKAGMFKALVQLLDENIESLKTKSFCPRKQDHTQAKYFPARKPEDGIVNWDSNATDLYNLVRALVAPFPGAITFYGGKKLVIERAEVVFNNKVYYTTGKVLKVDASGVLVTTQFNLLRIKEFRDVSIKSLRLEPGSFFSSTEHL